MVLYAHGKFSHALRKFSHAYENRRNLSTVFTTKLVYMVLNEHYIMIHMKEIAFSTVYEELFAKENARELCTATIVARIFSYRSQCF